MIIQKITRDLIKEVAARHNISFDKCQEIIYSQFEYLKHEMMAGDKTDETTYKSILLRGLGTFYFSVPKFRVLTLYKIGKLSSRRRLNEAIREEDDDETSN